MDWDLHPKQTSLSRALYVIRLRHGPFVSGGRWYHRTVAQRRQNNMREWDWRMKSEPWRPKRWQPPEGRESPREDWMSWRRFLDAYSYPGCVGAKRKLIATDNARRAYGSENEPRRMFSLRAAWGIDDERGAAF